jgi:hypothetical protein
MSGFNLNASARAASGIANFIACPLTGDLADVPGLGGTGVYADALRKCGVSSSHQLLGTFFELRAPNISSRAHCDAFVAYLRGAGIGGNSLNVVTRAIAEKATSIAPGIFDLAEL